MEPKSINTENIDIKDNFNLKIEIPGYKAEYIEIEERYGKYFYVIKIFRDNGDSLDRFYIPVCEHCFDAVEKKMYIEDKMPEIYSELFTKEN
jgi:HSP20 family molecular chaperone IbpA